MSDFEFIFVLYGLLLGLALAELLSGLGNALEARLTPRGQGERFRIGWLTPLLALFVMLDLLSFWVFAWRVRDDLVVSARGLLAVMLFSSAYYLAARLVFPKEPAALKTLDAHYEAVKRPVMAILVGLLAVQWAFLASLPGRAAMLTPLVIGLTLLLVALMAAVAFVRDQRLSIALLVVLVARYLWIYALS